MAVFCVDEKNAKVLEKSAVTGSVSEKAFLSQAIASPVSRNMTAGYLKLEAGYAKEIVSPVDEVDLVLSGAVTCFCDGNEVVARKGDILFIEKGTRAHFSTASDCLLFMVTYPLLQETVDALMKNAP